MERIFPVGILVLIFGLVCMGGCTAPASAPLATPAPAPAVSVPGSPLPTGTAAPVTSVYTWTTETAYTGHPYSKTYSFHGTGDYEEFTFSTENDATWIFTLTYPKEGVFTVVLKDAHGETLQVLANEGGAGTSRKTVSLKAGDYYFDIQADAPWYITMSTG